MVGAERLDDELGDPPGFSMEASGRSEMMTRLAEKPSRTALSSVWILTSSFSPKITVVRRPLVARSPPARGARPRYCGSARVWRRTKRGSLLPSSATTSSAWSAAAPRHRRPMMRTSVEREMTSTEPSRSRARGKIDSSLRQKLVTAGRNGPEPRPDRHLQRDIGAEAVAGNCVRAQARGKSAARRP